MLTYNDNVFTTSRARFFDTAPGYRGATSKIFVKIVIPAAGDVEVLAAVDTGTPWLILAPEIADSIGLLEAQGAPTQLQTPYGPKNGHLERATIVLVAEEGESLEVDATTFVCSDWPAGRNFLGYTGVLERIRFAVDSGSSSFFFGCAND